MTGRGLREVRLFGARETEESVGAMLFGLSAVVRRILEGLVGALSILVFVWAVARSVKADLVSLFAVVECFNA